MKAGSAHCCQSTIASNLSSHFDSTLTAPFHTTRKHSTLIQQLCRHITTLEQLNTELHEKIQKHELEKDIVCAGLGLGSADGCWETLVQDLQQKYYQEKNRMQNLRGFTKLINGLQDTGVSVVATPAKVDRNHSESLFQSPIQSESRIINRPIHGDTDRVQQQTIHQTLNNQNLFTLRAPFKQKGNCQPEAEQGRTLSQLKVQKEKQLSANIDLQDFSKERLDLRHCEQENMILSIENTKLRQRIAKLQAILASQSYS